MNGTGYLIAILSALYTSGWWMVIGCDLKSPGKFIGVVIVASGSAVLLVNLLVNLFSMVCNKLKKRKEVK